MDICRLTNLEKFSIKNSMPAMKTYEVIVRGRFASVKAIHAKAKTISIINHRWTVIFHTDDSYVMIDRIIPSKMVM